MQVKEWLLENKEGIFEIRRFFHQNPELTHQENNTAASIRRYLKEKGIPFLSFPKNITVALLSGEKPGKILGIRSDIDALPIKEETNLSFASRNNNVMHACGHDAHIAIGLVTAFYLHNHKSSFSGLVKIIFQPAEEEGNGAVDVIQTGSISDCDAFLALHVWPLMETGCIALSDGAVCASVDKLKFSICGRGGHAAYPELARDALLCSAHLASSLQFVVSRFLSPRETVVLSLGKIAAGTAWNIIAESALIEGTLRTFDDSLREKILDEIKNIVSNIAAFHHCSCDFKVENAGKVVFNDKDLTNIVKQSAVSVFGEVSQQTPSTIGDDFSYYRSIAPSCYAFLGAHKHGTPVYPLHHSKFSTDEEAILLGVEWLIRASIDFGEKSQ